MKRLTFVAFVVGLIALAAPSIAQSQIVIELDGFFEGPTDSVQLIDSVAVDPSLVGATCTGTGEIDNNASVHPNNDLILSSGDVSAEITDYESEPGAVIPLEGTVVLGDTIDISVRFGDHAQTSLGVIIVLDCAPVETTTTTTTTTTTEPPPTTTEPPPTTTEPPPTTTSTTAAPETTTTTTTTAAPTTTTSSAPLGGVGAGGGGTANNDALGWFALGAAGLLLAGTGATAAWRTRSDRR